MPRLIDAEAFAEKVYRAWDLWEKKENDCFVFSDIITPMLISMPTVDAEPVRHGYWETEVRTDGLGLKHCYYACSACGRAQDDETPYCALCGAKMDEVEDE